VYELFTKVHLLIKLILLRLQPNTNSGSSKFPFAEFVSQFFAHKLNVRSYASFNRAAGLLLYQADPPKPGIARTMVKNVIIEATPTEASAPDVQTDYTGGCTLMHFTLCMLCACMNCVLTLA
jgi:hypothetical protein